MNLTVIILFLAIWILYQVFRNTLKMIDLHKDIKICERYMKNQTDSIKKDVDRMRDNLYQIRRQLNDIEKEFNDLVVLDSNKEEE